MRIALWRVRWRAKWCVPGLSENSCGLYFARRCYRLIAKVRASGRLVRTWAALAVQGMRRPAAKGGDSPDFRSNQGAMLSNVVNSAINQRLKALAAAELAVWRGLHEMVADVSNRHSLVAEWCDQLPSQSLALGQQVGLKHHTQAIGCGHDQIRRRPRCLWPRRGDRARVNRENVGIAFCKHGGCHAGERMSSQLSLGIFKWAA